jgi:hypothetical protein
MHIRFWIPDHLSPKASAGQHFPDRELVDKDLSCGDVIQEERQIAADTAWGGIGSLEGRPIPVPGDVGKQ